MEPSDIVKIAETLYALKARDVFFWGIDVPTVIQALLALFALAYTVVTYNLLGQGREQLANTRAQLKHAEAQLAILTDAHKFRNRPVLTVDYTKKMPQQDALSKSLSVRNLTPNPALDVSAIVLFPNCNVLATDSYTSLAGNEETALSVTDLTDADIRKGLIESYGGNALKYFSSAQPHLVYAASRTNMLLVFYSDVEGNHYVTHHDIFFKDVMGPGGSGTETHTVL